MLKTYLKRLLYAIINKDLDETDYWDLDYTICKQLLHFIDDCGKKFRPFQYSESQRCDMLDEVRVYLDQIVNQTKEFGTDYKAEAEYETLCQNKISEFIGKNLFHLRY